MIQITPHMRIFIALEDIDFRKGIDGLAAACRQKLEQDPFSGVLFLFRNRKRNTLKILIYDGQGFWLCTKRLSKGKFQWWPEQKQPFTCIESSELQTLLWNGNPHFASFQEAWRKI
ncbi:MAG: IS66 family insertion sequence element accessory protein TnpB [Candidatus Babeliales bacterium]